jgi:hypothetical protein
VDRKQAEKQKEERRKEKRERVKVLEAKRSAFEVLEAKAMMAAKKKDEKHRNLLNLPIGAWELLDEDAKADRVDFYYQQKKREREEKKRKRDEKEAEVFTCKFFPREYGGKRNYGFCSSECREAAKKARRRSGFGVGGLGRRHCEHGRQKRLCRDCSPKSFCQHGRLKHQCKDCGTGHCQHGRQKHQRRDCR